MSLQDNIDAMHAIFDQPGERSESDLQVLAIGQTSEFMMMAIGRFESLINQYPDVAAQVVAEFKAAPEFQTLMRILGNM